VIKGKGLVASHMTNREGKLFEAKLFIMYDVTGGSFRFFIEVYVGNLDINIECCF
jgi:hypothetical protein